VPATNWPGSKFERGDRLSEAQTIVYNVVNTVEDVAENAVTSFVAIIGHFVGEVGKMVTVARYTVFGQQISRARLSHARAVAHTVASRPPGGSKDWLDLQAIFRQQWNSENLFAEIATREVAVLDALVGRGFGDPDIPPRPYSRQHL